MIQAFNKQLAQNLASAMHPSFWAQQRHRLVFQLKIIRTHPPQSPLHFSMSACHWHFSIHPLRPPCLFKTYPVDRCQIATALLACRPRMHNAAGMAAALAKKKTWKKQEHSKQMPPPVSCEQACGTGVRLLYNGEIFRECRPGKYVTNGRKKKRSFAIFYKF